MRAMLVVISFDYDASLRPRGRSARQPRRASRRLVLRSPAPGPYSISTGADRRVLKSGAAREDSSSRHTTQRGYAALHHTTVVSTPEQAANQPRVSTGSGRNPQGCIQI